MLMTSVWSYFIHLWVKGIISLTFVETRGSLKLSRWLPWWLNTKCCSLALGMKNWSWTSSPSMDEQKVKACKEHSDNCNNRIHSIWEMMLEDLSNKNQGQEESLYWCLKVWSVAHLCSRNRLAVLMTLLTMVKGIMGSKPTQAYWLCRSLALCLVLSFFLELCKQTIRLVFIMQKFSLAG